MIPMHSDFARGRAQAYLQAHGARVEIQRKVGPGWVVQETNVPCMIERVQGGTQLGVDTVDTNLDGQLLYRLSMEPGTNLREGDRVQITAGDGPEAPLTVMDAHRTSLDVYLQAVAVIERMAVETFPIAIERYDDLTAAWVEVWSGNAHLTRTDRAGENVGGGAAGRRITGLVVIDPAPQVAIGVGDWVVGIPWAKGAEVTRVRPQVGDRLELDYQATV